MKRTSLFATILFLVIPFQSFALETITKIVHTTGGIVFRILIAVSILFIIISGIMFILGGGDPGKIEIGKKTLLWAIIGLTIGALAWPLIYWVGSFSKIK